MTNDVLLEALRLNDAHVRGVTRLDQQLVYVPLGVLAAAVYQVGATAVLPGLSVPGAGRFVWVVLILVALLVLAGLYRNHRQHEALLTERNELRARLGLGREPRGAPLWVGRAIYYSLFVLGLVVGGMVLVVGLAVRGLG